MLLQRTTLCFATFVLGFAAPASAQNGRQYYESSWFYDNNNGYYYTQYYFKTTVTQTTYEYNYAIYYPTQPTYIYYYNPTSQTYWGRYLIGSKEDKRYSMLEPKDRKKEVSEIPESAFPQPAAMPMIPGASDNVAMLPPPENVPKDKKPK